MFRIVLFDNRSRGRSVSINLWQLSQHLIPYWTVLAFDYRLYWAMHPPCHTIRTVSLRHCFVTFEFGPRKEHTKCQTPSPAAKYMPPIQYWSNKAHWHQPQKLWKPSYSHGQCQFLSTDISGRNPQLEPAQDATWDFRNNWRALEIELKKSFTYTTFSAVESARRAKATNLFVPVPATVTSFFVSHSFHQTWIAATNHKESH